MTTAFYELLEDIGIIKMNELLGRTESFRRFSALTIPAIVQDLFVRGFQIVK